ncbi:response regulator [Ectothiorhodospiraceae bacterium BW-2]|nr:response regulator [Ectothiorhodospiraceae bacterium BW-2]
MRERSGQQVNLHRLRQRVKEAMESHQRWLAEHDNPTEPLSDESALVQQLLEELHLYQAELEQQNQELLVAESKASLNLERYRLLFHLIPLPALVVDSRGILVELNQQAQKLFQLQSSELLHRPLLRLFQRQDREVLHELLKRDTEGQPYTLGPVRLAGSLDNRGEEGVVDIHLMALPGGETAVGQQLLLLVDKETEFALQQASAELVEHQRHLERLVAERSTELLRSQQLYSTVLQYTVDWETWIRADGELLFCSPSCYHITGYHERQFQQQPDLLLEIVHPDDQRQVRHHFANHFDNEAPGAITFRIYRADGSVCWLEHICRAVVDSESGEISRRASNRDVTERQEADRQLKQSRQRLEQAIIAAENANRAKSQFLANMSHEIRTPMNAIIGMSQLALSGSLEARERNFLEKIHLSGRNLMRIINDILDYSKGEAGKITLEKIEFNLESVLDSIANQLRLQAKEKQLEFNIVLQPQLPLNLIGDPLRLEQILSNLSANAIKFTPKGGEIEITISLANEQCSPESVELLCSVCDSGIGISPEQQQFLFQPFVQADSTTTRQYGGTGLGLSIVQQLVTLMGGRVWLESELGQGSRFSFTVTLGRQRVVSSAGDSKRLQRLKLLVIDDNRVSMNAHVAQLQLLGVRFESESLVYQALAKIEAQARAGEPYTHLLLDWRMPEMTGVELVQRLMCIEPRFELPKVIFVTCHNAQLVAEQTQTMPSVVAVLDKPLLPSVLKQALLATTTLKLIVAGDMPRRRRATVPHSLPRRRVLLVEDNDLNRELALELLSQYPLQVVSVNNGAEALQQFEQQRFDLILMDIQMPVMDGYSATREIRRRGASAQVPFQVPIIAMSANTMAEDRQRAFTAGMNGYLTKPIDTEQFEATLMKWLAAESGSVNPASATIEADLLLRGVASSLAPLEGVINVHQGLKAANGNPKLYQKLLYRFIDNQGHFSESFTQALEESQPQTLIRLAHTLKGVAANIGAERLSELASVLELQCRESSADCESSFLALKQELERVMAALKACHWEELTPVGDDSDEAEISSFDREALTEQLNSVSQAMQCYQYDTAQKLQPLFKLLGSRQQDQLERVAALVDEFEYEEAHRQLTVLAQRLGAKLTG